MLDTILAALRAADLAAAETAARQLIAEQPGLADAHHLLGLALQQGGDLNNAAASVDRAIALAPQRAQFHVSRAMIANEQRDPDAARRALAEAVRQDPNQLLAYVNLAQMALAASDLDGAEQHVLFAERVNPEHPHVRTVRGQLLLARGQSEAAIATLSRAGETAPEDPMVQGALGLALLSQRHYAFAEQALRNALRSNAAVRSLRYALVQSLLAQNRIDDASTEVETLLAQRGDDPQALTLKGQIASARGAHEEAVIALTASLRQVPQQQRALESLLSSWDALKAADQAEAFVESLLAQAPAFEPAWAALVELQRGRPQRAADTAGRWFDACPGSATASELAAQIAEANGDFARTRELAGQSLSIDRGRLGAHVLLARADLRDGDGAAARARLEPLFEVLGDPAAKRALGGWLGRACDAAGDPVSAVRYWQQAHANIAQLRPYPALSAPDATLEARLNDAIAADTGEPAADAPRLLWGAPGSNPERLAALLQGSGNVVLNDRFGASPRDDGFDVGSLGSRSASSPEEAGVRFGQRWRDGLAAIGAPASIVDWLPHFDARLAPPLVRGLPGARLLVALRDPRDMLLNWLAFGAPQRLSAADVTAAAQWLVLALEQLAFLANRAQPAVRVVWIDELLTAPEAVLQGLAEFFGLAATPSIDALQPSLCGAGGLATAFPAGHWKNYEEALREPFALLEPIAARLGSG